MKAADTANTDPRAALPLSQYVTFHSRNVDEIRAAFAANYPGARFDPQTKTDVSLRAHDVILGSWKLGFRTVEGIARRVLSPLDAFILVLPIQGGFTVASGTETVDVSPEAGGVLVSPCMSIEARTEMAHRHCVMTLGRAALEAHLDLITGRPPKGPLEFATRLNLSSSSWNSIQRLIEFTVAELDRSDSLTKDTRRSSTLQDSLMTWLLTSQPHNHATYFEARPLHGSPKQVRAVEDYIHAHIRDPISLATLARVAGVSGRSLQATFKAHWGVSPRAFLKVKRLDLARERLLGALPGCTVSQIALDCGFNHFGQFSVDYKRRFGESPRVTLKR